MTDRLPLGQHTDDTLTALYDQRDQLRVMYNAACVSEDDLINERDKLREERTEMSRLYLTAGQEQVADRSTIERLRAEREQARRIAVALENELAAAEAKVAEYENAITWHTDCLSCARVLDSCIRETHRAEHAEAERNQHAATVQRALAECDRIAQLPAVADDSGRADTFDTGARWTLRMIQTALTGSCPGCAVPGCGCDNAEAAQADTEGSAR